MMHPYTVNYQFISIDTPTDVINPVTVMLTSTGELVRFIASPTKALALL